MPYAEAEALQRAIHEHADADYLLLQEHPHVYTLGSSANPEHVLRDPASVGAELVPADRGGDVTYHGPASSSATRSSRSRSGRRASATSSRTSASSKTS